MAKKPEALPPESPFTETEEQGSLRRIAEGSRGRRQAWENMIAAKLSYKQAKADYEAAITNEHSIIDSETFELPLFPRLKAAADSPVTSEPSKPEPVTPSSEFVSLASLDGFPPSAFVALGLHGIQTVADLDAFLDGGGTLESVDGFNAGMAHRVRAAVSRHKQGKGAA